MAGKTFEDRLARLAEQAATTEAPSAPAPQPAPAPRRPSALVTFLIGTVFLFTGFAGAFIVKLARDPEMTPTAVFYVELMASAAAFVVFMLGTAVAALATRLRQPILNRIALFTLAGYGIMSTLLKLAIA